MMEIPDTLEMRSSFKSAHQLSARNPSRTRPALWESCTTVRLGALSRSRFVNRAACDVSMVITSSEAWTLSGHCEEYTGTVRASHQQLVQAWEELDISPDQQDDFLRQTAVNAEAVWEQAIHAAQTAIETAKEQTAEAERRTAKLKADLSDEHFGYSEVSPVSDPSPWVGTVMIASYQTCCLLNCSHAPLQRWYSLGRFEIRVWCKETHNTSGLALRGHCTLSSCSWVRLHRLLKSARNNDLGILFMKDFHTTWTLFFVRFMAVSGMHVESGRGIA